VKDNKRSWVLDWPQVPDGWPVLSGTNLTCEETLLLHDAGFKLQGMWLAREPGAGSRDKESGEQGLS
jgi:hypothetical protein